MVSSLLLSWASVVTAAADDEGISVSLARIEKLQRQSSAERYRHFKIEMRLSKLLWAILDRQWQAENACNPCWIVQACCTKINIATFLQISQMQAHDQLNKMAHRLQKPTAGTWPGKVWEQLIISIKQLAKRKLISFVILPRPKKRIMKDRWCDVYCYSIKHFVLVHGKVW